MVEGARVRRAPRRERPLGTAVYNRIVKNTYENRTRRNPARKEPVRGGGPAITRTPSGEEGEYFHSELL